MKALIIILIIHLITSNLIKAQINDSMLIVCCFKETYSSGKTLHFAVTNITNKKFYFAIALEEYLKNSWVQITNDIFKENFSKSRQIIFLDSMEYINLEWDTGKFPLIKVEAKRDVKNYQLIGKFRLVLEYGYIYDCLSYKFISNSFVLRK